MPRTPNPMVEGKKITNPMLDDDTMEEMEEEMSAAHMIEANSSEMTEDELADLTYAFQAADMDGAGSIDSNEFEMMLRVMGCDITMDQVQHVMDAAREGFGAWKKMADQENIAKCQRIWDEYDADKSGTMDLSEVNAVIAKLKSMGFTPDPMSKEDMADGELDFDEFSAWFLKQEGLPDDFLPPDPNAKPGGIPTEKKKGLVGNLLTAALMPLSMATKVAMGPLDLLAASAKKLAVKDQNNDGVIDTDGIEAAALEALEAEDQLIFAEFVFMMRAGLLKQFLKDDWQERAEDMRKLREAFDCADVDGNNQLELEELEMVIISMNPKVSISPADVGRVWEVLNPDKRDWIPFEVYVEGMIKVKADPELSQLVPMEVPNRFELLSLLIDSPINEDQEKLIFDKLTGLEKGGIRMLEKMSKPMDKAKIEATLQQACAGRLHYLTDAQRKSVRITHLWCVLQACFIGTFFTFWPGLLENFLVYTYETDGAADAYWTCAEYIGDPAAPEYEGLQLPTCKPGLCTSVPDGLDGRDNVTDYLNAGGNAAMGGNWTDGDGPCPLTGIPPKKVCYDDCTPLLQTWTHDHEKLIKFWIINVLGIVTGIVFELSLLMYTAVRSAVRVSWSLDLRLTPLNADRAFVANMLVRAAFEMGDPDGAVMGVESSKEAEAEKPGFIKNLFAVAFIKGKVVLTGVLFKLFTAKLVSYDTATWLKPYSGTMLATAMWDTMMCHVIMKNAEIRAFGVTTSVEVFNEILDTYCPLYEADPSTLSEAARVQILRAIGVAIVKHGSLFPTMEILLRHAVNYLQMKKSKAVNTAGIIDNENCLSDDFDLLSLDESRAVLSVHMLCYVLDGSIGRSELALWKKLLARVEELYQVERAKFDSLTATELREYIVLKAPKLRKAIERVPAGPSNWPGVKDPAAAEIEELLDLASFVSRPETVTRFDHLIPRVICQKFRNNTPVSYRMIAACFDPEHNKTFMARTLTPDELSKFTFNEFVFRATSLLTAQV